MSKLVLDFQVPSTYDKSGMTDIIRAITTQLNALSEGKISARYQSSTVQPNSTAQSYQKGDIVWNSNPTELGSVAAGIAAKYIVEGWECTTAGTGATAVFKERRILTGN